MFGFSCSSTAVFSTSGSKTTHQTVNHHATPRRSIIFNSIKIKYSSFNFDACLHSVSVSNITQIFAKTRLSDYAQLIYSTLQNWGRYQLYHEKYTGLFAFDNSIFWLRQNKTLYAGFSLGQRLDPMQIAAEARRTKRKVSPQQFLLFEFFVRIY